MNTLAHEDTCTNKRREVVLAGSGGQGLVFLGRLVGQAAARAGLRVVQTQSYGVASRGGFSKSEVIVSEAPIAYPMAMDPWGVLALTDEARRMYRQGESANRLVVFDRYLSSDPEAAGERGFPFTQESRSLNIEGSFNLMALGAFLALRPVVPYAEVLSILREDGSARGEANVEAFQHGVHLAGDS